MKKEQSLHIDTTVDVSENNSNSTLIERENIENTPFTVITENGYSFGVMAEYRITEKYDTVEEVKQELKEITWNKIVQITALLIEKLK
jgi:hypothetical protein